MHDILLEDESPGGVDKFVSKFKAECLTWSKLRHPGVVQFLGVHMDRRSRLPVLVMEKMDTSLRTYLENHSKEQFLLHQKAFVLRQVTQALAYLHSQNPPLVHHDLSPNNVLLNVVSFVTKVSDFGMSRAINPSALTRKSSIKGTQAFMAPEALHDPPRYNEKLDVFSFGNIVISTLTHKWSNPGPPTKYEGDVFSKEEFLLHQKAFVLRQVTQALAYLHSQNPPLVHHDLSPNNVLLNVVSFVTKVSDFGMSRAINPSALSRKSSIKGTQAFMAPEALHDPPRYNEKLDVFSFGNVVISTLTHEWPNPGPPTKYEGDMFVAVTELQRREHYVVKFTAQEKQLFLPIVCQCLENRPDKRPSSVMLVQELRRIESTLQRDSNVTALVEHLQQQLSAKEEECGDYKEQQGYEYEG